MTRERVELMTSKVALSLTDKFQEAISLLTLHGLLTDGERHKVRVRMDQWAIRHSLRVKP